MKNNKKRILISAALLFVLVILTFSVAYANLQASAVFVSKTVSLSTSMRSSISCSTSVDCKKIYVSAVKLEKKIGTDWVSTTSLPCPSTTAVNTDIFGAGMDYSSYCTKGNTYRIVVTFNADGTTASATSGSNTYK